ncbi:hypothetical protein MesoLj113b_39140 [Mesorhizobium sp. 113-3-3]|nr:hypothetical protein MesoLj113b_39140 [Mesorhizobium sp. 113-3-3]
MKSGLAPVAPRHRIADDETGNDEENINPQKAIGEALAIQMVEDDRQDRDGPEPIKESQVVLRRAFRGRTKAIGHWTKHAFL